MHSSQQTVQENGNSLELAVSMYLFLTRLRYNGR